MPTTVTRPTIAALLMLSARHISRMVAAGVLPRAERGRYELIPVVQAYIRYLQARTLGGDARDGDGEDITKGRARLIGARARVAQVEADLAETMSFKRQDVEAAWLQIMLAVRAQLLVLPSKMALQVIDIKSPSEAQVILTQAVHDALTELANMPVEVAAAA